MPFTKAPVAQPEKLPEKDIFDFDAGMCGADNHELDPFRAF
ncbi:unnamed protein product, partial [marine sediment metagenome]